MNELITLYMGVSKRLGFDEETEIIGRFCKALGHPVRIQIMTLLWKKDNRTCGEIVDMIPLAQSTISKHLLELKKASLVNIKNEGKKVIYSIEVDNFKVLKKYFKSYLSTIDLEEKEKSTVLKTKNRIGRNSHLKQYNYQFPDKRIKQIAV